uniref:FAD dependent oxidoreductase domain-containing protein n=1 Tax=Schizophyllum commune (strain H4-8 / FGSC 9210) TaxID=578458 RepID=D8Q9G8_SCHCM
MRVSLEYSEVLRRVDASPGLPIEAPSSPYWTVPPSPISDHGAAEDKPLPSHADVVIIGSGITGACVARTLLDEGPEGLKVVMLDARAICSGATARNGGHITPALYHDYTALKKELGAEAAEHIMRFRLAHLDEFLKVADEEGLLDGSQCREVQTYDVFFNDSLFHEAKALLRKYLSELNSERCFWKILSRETAMKEIHASDRVAGVITTRAGAIHPYRLVTGILERLLTRYPETFSLFSYTPCVEISAQDGYYLVNTPKGILRTSHVVHATNAWSSHLLQGMRRKIMPMRATMSAQLPKSSTKLDAPPANPYPWFGTRSFVIYPTASWTHYDYLTQQPTPPSGMRPYPHPHAEFMYGGGVSHAYTSPAAIGAGGHGEIACTDDGSIDLGVRAYLGGALGAYFGSEFGASARDGGSTGEPEEPVRKHFWTGLEGISADGRPWVGSRLPHEITGRKLGRQAAKAGPLATPASSAAPGEWICAGYTGEGMVHAWLCAKAMARMLLGTEGEDRAEYKCGESKFARLPDAYRFSMKRWKAAKMEDRLGKD